MNVFDWWSGRNGVVAFAVTNMNWETFSKESHEFQCGESIDTDTSLYHPKDFEKAMRDRGFEITVYIPSQSADWWCND